MIRIVNCWIIEQIFTSRKVVASQISSARVINTFDIIQQIKGERHLADLHAKPLPFDRIQELCKLAGVEHDQDWMTRAAPEFHVP